MHSNNGGFDGEHRIGHLILAGGGLQVTMQEQRMGGCMELLPSDFAYGADRLG